MCQISSSSLKVFSFLKSFFLDKLIFVTVPCSKLGLFSTYQAVRGTVQEGRTVLVLSTVPQVHWLYQVPEASLAAWKHHLISWKFLFSCFLFWQYRCCFLHTKEIVSLAHLCLKKTIFMFIAKNMTTFFCHLGVLMQQFLSLIKEDEGSNYNPL